MRVIPVKSFNRNYSKSFKGANIPNGSGSIPAIITDSVSLAGAGAAGTAATTGVAAKAVLLTLGKVGLIIGGIVAGGYLLKKAGEKIDEKMREKFNLPEVDEEYDYYCSMNEDNYDPWDPIAHP